MAVIYASQQVNDIDLGSVDVGLVAALMHRIPGDP
jgi:hypothetical protein